jgi:hypothetical protein
MFYGCASFRVSAFGFCCSGALASISTFMPSGAGCWVYSTTGVGFTGVVFGDGISFILTISDRCCSPSFNCTRALVLTLGCLVVWFSFALFGGSMVVNFNCLLCFVASTTSVIFSLCFGYTVTLCFFYNLAITCLFLRPCFVWSSQEACRGCYLLKWIQ